MMKEVNARWSCLTVQAIKDKIWVEAQKKIREDEGKKK